MKNKNEEINEKVSEEVDEQTDEQALQIKESGNIKDFEKNMVKLENVVKKLENGNLSLEIMIKLFEEGINISRNCNDILDKAERKIEVLIKSENEIKTQNFDVSSINE